VGKDIYFDKVQCESAKRFKQFFDMDDIRGLTISEDIQDLTLGRVLNRISILSSFAI